jgi:hypothetical protein
MLVVMAGQSLYAIRVQAAAGQFEIWPGLLAQARGLRIEHHVLGALNAKNVGTA